MNNKAVAFVNRSLFLKNSDTYKTIISVAFAENTPPFFKRGHEVVRMTFYYIYFP